MNDSVNQPDVTLVIPGRNVAGVIKRCLESVTPLVGNDGLREIIFVDDRSTDATEEIVKQYPVRYLPVSGQGRGAARNTGWQAAQTPLIWFIDADTVTEPDALRVLLPHLDDESVAGVGGSYGNMRPDSLLACLIHEEIISRHLAMPREVNFLATFNILYRRSVLEEVGGFGDLPRGQDAELAFRICQAGFRLRFDPQSRVAHFHPTRLWRYLLTQARHGYFRMQLYAMYPSRAKGDSYSGPVDHAQPPLAMLMLAALILLPWPGVRWIPIALAVLLALLQIPMTASIVRRTGKLRYLAFGPMSFVRAIARGVGMTLGLLRFGPQLLTGSARVKTGPKEDHDLRDASVTKQA